MSHALAMPSLMIKLSSKHEKMCDGAASVTKDLIREIFSSHGKGMITLPKGLRLDWGFWSWELTTYLLSS